MKVLQSDENSQLENVSGVESVERWGEPWVVCSDLQTATQMELMSGYHLVVQTVDCLVHYLVHR